MSPFGVIPKSEKSEVGKWRLILDLSSPEGFSVNGGIKRELCSLPYMPVDEVARRVMDLGKGTLMAKFDLKAALTPGLMRILSKYWEREATNYESIMLWAACCVCYFGFL